MSTDTEPTENPDEQPDEDDSTEWRTATSRTLDMSKSVSEMTNAELRAKLAQRTGHRPPRHAVTKRILNSLHAWFTGEFYLKPARLKPGVPPKRELLEQVVRDAISAYEDHPTDPDDDDRADHPADALLDYLDAVQYAPDHQTARAMNKSELQQFISAMDTNEDSRGWTEK
jgi:hypothetical protein